MSAAAENILPGAVGGLSTTPLVPEPEPEPQGEDSASPTAGQRAHDFGSLPAYWAARVQNKAWQRHVKGGRAHSATAHEASALLDLALDGHSASGFRRKIAALRFVGTQANAGRRAQLGSHGCR